MGVGSFAPKGWGDGAGRGGWGWEGELGGA